MPVQLDSLHVIFTGGNYWKIPELPGKFESDFKIISGYRWIKGSKSWSTRWKMFPCPKHYQKLTKDEAKAQGLI